MKVFISSTYVDLKGYRQAAIDVVNRYECTPLAMEFFMAQPGEPTKVCDKEIKKCDIFVGIYAHRFGFMPKGQENSITQQEYELAKKLGKDCLCFIIEEDYPWNPGYIEMDKYAKLQDFLSEVRDEKTMKSFGTVADFDSKLSSSLGKLLLAKQSKEEQVVQEVAGKKRTFVPPPPTPYIAHSYPLPEFFTGREAEKALLSNWFFNEEEPVLVMEAIGGMGKSALSWVWLHSRVIEAGAEVEGILWWSFYETPFDCFLRELSCYVLGSHDREEGVNQDRLQAALFSRRFLLVLDGFERALRGYSSMNAMYMDSVNKGVTDLNRSFCGGPGGSAHKLRWAIRADAAERSSLYKFSKSAPLVAEGKESKVPGMDIEEAEWERRQREAVHPGAERFLRHLLSGKTKTLITTRLMPAALEGYSGVKRVFLEGLNPGDAVTFFRSEGIKGSRAELEQAGEVYDYHPLMLKLLTSAIKRGRKKDIKDAYGLDLIDEKEPQKILTAGYNLLIKEEQQVVSRVAVFRGVFSFDSARALFPETGEDRLWQTLEELCRLGFLFYNEKEESFDFHPILRSYLYHNLTGREEAHIRAVQYFQSLPKPEKVISLDDLSPVIELYHHLVKAGKFDEAVDLFYERITAPTYYQLSAYQLRIELLRELFPDGEDNLPRLKEEAYQGWTLNTLANSYSQTGQPGKAMPFFLQCVKIPEKNINKENLAIGLGNVAYMAQIYIGQLSAAAAHLQKSINLCREVGDEFGEAVGHQEWGRVLVFQGRESAEDEFNQAFDLAEKTDNIQIKGVVSCYRSISYLLQERLKELCHTEEKDASIQSLGSLSWARRSLECIEEWSKTNYPLPRDFVQAYRLLGEALIQCFLSPAAVKFEPFEIRFYDEHFREIMETLKAAPGKELTGAERCLTEALRRCRKINLVELEPDILSGTARLEWAKQLSKKSPEGEPNLEDIEKILTEARDISLRSGYRLKLADIHLFCALVLKRRKEPGTLLGMNAAEHLQKAREYALDVSELSDLYQSADPHFYESIPEYDMLKKGLTDEERIKNGYYMAYQLAEAIEKL